MSSPKTISIRGLLERNLLLGISLVLIAFMTLLGWVARSVFQDRFDEAVLDEAEVLALLTIQTDQGLDLLFSHTIMPEYEDPRGPHYFEIWGPDGQLLERSHSLQNRKLLENYEYFPEPVFTDLELPPHGPCRLVTLSFSPQHDSRSSTTENSADGPPPSLTIALAERREELDELYSQTLWIQGIALLCLMALIFWQVRRGLHKGLAPLNRLGQTLASWGPNQLNTPLQDPAVRELTPIINQLNGLLKRVADRLENERLFSQNVAHELRTPIAELASLAEVGRTWPENRQAVEGFFEDVGHISQHMQKMVANLLGLARSESHRIQINKEELDLATLWDRVQERMRLLNPNAPAWRGNLPAVSIVSDESMLELVLLNLVQNAVAHALPPADLAVAFEEQDNHWVLSLSNRSEPFTPDQLQDMFRPFWRKHPGSGDGFHSGLGLALVEHYCAALQIGIEAHYVAPTFSIRLHMPKNQPDQ
ncbi:MAG: sensor histidine kinase N-terminal domain-containing protein [Acidobacteria bacterium]|nr:sensor histidine kinase N-terminal domain-containing protein [Acidobacteriota bacterium]MCB9397985.1 sensor histidine kinase N-terminal domain-containing protein [Acidobacteriota bacterium]